LIYLCAMLRQIAATILLLAFSVQTFSNPLIMLGYYANTAAYAKNCENKARPKMHCNGKCQLMKKMQQEEKKDQQYPERKTEGKAEVLSSKSFFASLVIPVLILKELFVNPQTDRPVDRTLSVFHPPQA